jgi:hypothetical protein
MKKQRSVDLRHVGNIPKETLDFLENKKATGSRKNVLIGFGTLMVVLMLFVFVLNCAFGDKAPKSSQESTTSESKPALAGLSSNSLANCNLADAESVLTSALRMADVAESQSKMIYIFRSDWWETVEPKVKELSEGIADADACEHKTARLILFQDPSGKEIGRADPITGFRFP